jgi:hypothetical protein
MPYHVRITHKNPQRRSSDTLALDKDEAWLDSQIVQPRIEGRPIFVSGQVIEWSDIDEIHITRTDRSSAELLPEIRARRASERVFTPIPDEWYVARYGEDLTEHFLSGAPGQGAAQRNEAQPGKDEAAVMVVHGQDEEAALALFDWLRRIGLRPREWAQLRRSTANSSPFIGEVLEQAFQESQAVVVLFTPDEHVALRHELTGRAEGWRLQARPNVLFEAGMAFATHPARTVLVVLGPQELPSDLAGRHYVRLGSPAGLHDLASRLETAGCPVDLSGDQWLDATRFPDRSDVPPEPSLAAAPRDAGRDGAYTNLLSAHAELVQAYSGDHIYDNRVRAARKAFDDAQSAVVIAGSPAARIAAEELLIAWAPDGTRLSMAGEWRQRVAAAREKFIAAVGT